jgi:hypothetical protein
MPLRRGSAEGGRQENIEVLLSERATYVQMPILGR